MADDDHVGEAKEDIQAVQDIVGAGPANPPAPPAPPPITPPPLDTADLDAQYDQARQQRDAASLESSMYSAQALTATDPVVAADLKEKAREAQNKSLHYQEQVNKVQGQIEQRQMLAKQGCSPALITIFAILGLIAVVAAIVIKGGFLDKDDDSTTTSAGAAVSSSCDESGVRADHLVLIDCTTPSPLDGHWVLVDGLQNTYADMGLSCSHVCDQPGSQLSVDKSEVTIDISGDKVTGGLFKTGFTSGSGCTVLESRVDATVTGGVDQAKAYGQLIVDGNETRKSSCDSNSQEVVTKQAFHTSRFFIVKDDTLTLCYNLNATFDACTTTGMSLTPAELPSGIAATFKRG